MVDTGVAISTAASRLRIELNGRKIAGFVRLIRCRLLYSCAEIAHVNLEIDGVNLEIDGVYLQIDGVNLKINGVNLEIAQGNSQIDGVWGLLRRRFGSQ